MATLTTLLADTRALLDDSQQSSSAYRWSDASLTQYLNEAQYEFNQLTQLYKGTASRALSQNVREYRFNTSVGASATIIGPILRVETSSNKVNLNLTTEERLDTLKPGWFAEAASSSAPTRFIRSKLNYDTIIIYPTPNSTAQSTYGSLVAYGALLPADLSVGADVPNIPAQYHQALPYGAAYRALLLNQDADSMNLANVYKTRFNEFVAMGQADNKVSLTSGTSIQGTI
jgi:hypothetical protein